MKLILCVTDWSHAPSTFSNKSLGYFQPSQWSTTWNLTLSLSSAWWNGHASNLLTLSITGSLHGWDESACWKASVCCIRCLQWHPGLRPPLRRLCLEVVMGYGPWQESVLQSEMRIPQPPLHQHRHIYRLGGEVTEYRVLRKQCHRLE